MLATHMNKALIDVDQSRTRYGYITIECYRYKRLDEFKSRLRKSTMASPCRANHGG
jgi:phage FluMu protein Com